MQALDGDRRPQRLAAVVPPGRRGRTFRTSCCGSRGRRAGKCHELGIEEWRERCTVRRSMRLRSVRIVIVTTLLGCFARRAGGADELAPEPARTAAVASLALGLILGAELTPGTLVPAQSTWCEPP